MPYNNTPITPSKEVTGTVALPLARVKKIIQQDPDIAQCSNNAAFVLTVATEMFLQHLVSQAHVQAKSDKKPRRNIQYKDVATAVTRVENLEFLTDVVPKTMTFKQYREEAVKERSNKVNGVDAGAGVWKGQGTLDGHFGAGKGGEGVEQVVNGAVVGDGMDVDLDVDDVEEDKEEDREATKSPPPEAQDDEEMEE